MHAFEETSVRLPEESTFRLLTGSYAYGAVHEASRYCGFDQVPYPPEGLWQSVWHPDYVEASVSYLMGEEEASKSTTYWVMQETHALSLREQGFSGAQALGHAALYLQEISIPRLKNSLLILLPQPSYGSDYGKYIECYLSEIASIRDRFDCVAACMHPKQARDSALLEVFKRAGIEIVLNGFLVGRNALLRWQWLMSRFEYVTTGLPDLQIVLGAYWGAKVSIYGSIPELPREDFEAHPIFRSQPELLSRHIDYYRESCLREHYSFLFSEPWKAQTNTDWGRQQLGESSKKDSIALANIFHWPCPKIVQTQVVSKIEAVSAIFPELNINQLGQPVKSSQASSVFSCLQKQARAGSAESQFCLGVVFYTGMYWNYQDTPEALRWLCLAADQGYVRAMIYLALILGSADRTPDEQKQAIAWLHKAAESGNADAQALLTP